MPTTTESRPTTQLKKRVEEQHKSIVSVLNRISDLADEISLLRGEIKRFKADVADDVKYLTERVDG